MKKINKLSLFLIIIGISLIPLLVISEPVLADGMIIKPDPYSDRWDYLGESNQEAFINYESGLEKMILSIGIEEASENAVWIFPVPADPDKTVIDVVTKIPQLRGEEVTQKAKLNLLYIKEILPMTQIYTIPFVSLGGVMYMGEGTLGTPSTGLGGYDVETDVIIHEQLVKEGITTEIITAKTAQSLYQYLKEKGLKIEQNSIPVLDYYIGKEFTFVISWISSQKSPLGQRGIFVTFPTDKIYYPLLPTNVYESQTIPITIRVVGFVSPEIFNDIKSYVEISYYLDENVYISLGAHGYSENEFKSISEFLGSTIKTKSNYGANLGDIKYTKIEINAPSKTFTDDLWINNRAPLSTIPVFFIASHPFATGVILLILISIISSLFASVVVFREARNKKGLIKFALIGIFNCFSIIGLIIATLFVATKEIKEGDKELFAELKKKGYSPRAIQSSDLRKLGFIPLFSVLFLGFSWAIIEIIKVIL